MTSATADPKTKCYEKVTRPEVPNQNVQYTHGGRRSHFLFAFPVTDNKWTVRAISHLIDLSVINAWLKYRQKQIKEGIQKKIYLSYANTN